jgi:transcriptional regulator PpsR
VKAFRAPKTALGRLDAEAAAQLVARAADITLVLDETGTIRDVAIAAPELAADLAGHLRWYGKRLLDVVTAESTSKVELLLASARSLQISEWRQLNHPATSGPDVPLLYVVVPAGSRRLVAFGRDQRPLSLLQRRLVDAQQSIERDYARIRHVEMRYRLLLQMAPEAMLVIDGASRRVVESNPTARQLLGDLAASRESLSVSRLFTADTAQSVELLLAGVLASGRPDDVRARLIEGEREVLVSTTPFRDEGGFAFLIRIAAPHSDPAAIVVPKVHSKLLKLLESAPDAFVARGRAGSDRKCSVPGACTITEQGAGPRRVPGTLAGSRRR